MSNDTDNQNKKRKRGIVCCFCGEAWGYDDEDPTQELIKAACDHEKICPHNPYNKRIAELERELANANKRNQQLEGVLDGLAEYQSKSLAASYSHKGAIEHNILGYEWPFVLAGDYHRMVKHMTKQIDKLQDELGKAVGWLKGQWVDVQYCPECKSSKYEEHEQGCEFQAFLQSHKPTIQTNP